ncbi:2-dehydro-3-deoxy-6-phosphogalactonate aldolase [Halomonas dongshanensis]|uniref:2-dehydro-3-deoxy-6-phosphogalactonate aldolase n=1 Tax=Halomonas dongshanensis TaxID=2890835 RepID=A0ABT2EDS0_9GAMM|nr:2-dehydro-3-deoxy-6-phosphogalactonate aldolase [Halomonas dongshanensis]MCS2609230.1 2-dehydro-3-deoxy-6-phosphogalactonate aldolase [Halomonas dongshanensis]
MATRTNLIAILRGIEPHEAVAHTEQLLALGLVDIEIPTNSPKWFESVQMVVENFGSDLNIGVGTVTSATLARQAREAGARYIVTPNLDPSVIDMARSLGLKTCIGVFSASEIFAAVSMGVDLLKVFPAAALPTEYPKYIKGPLSETVRFAAVGGIDASNAQAFLAHYDAIGLGSAIYKPGQSVEQTASKGRAVQALMRTAN